MDAVRWQRLSPLLDGLLDLPPAERELELARLRGEDPALAAELEALLAAEEGGGDFLHDPLPGTRPASREGTRLGPYRLERLLGEGGMGQVWLAERADGLYRRRLALKLLRPGYADPNLRLRFSREREILARLQHPNIARLLDAGVGEGDQPYLVLEYVEGVPLTEYCDRHALPLEARLRLFLQVCAAVSHAHANLIVHRDLKPSNMLVTAEREVQLLDFGIAKLLDRDAADVHARTEVRAFTLHYAAPEQVRGEPVSTLTDVYSLGVVLYELLAGDKPYRLRRQSDAEWERAILEVSPPRPSVTVQRLAENGLLDPAQARKLARRLRGDLDNILLKALNKTPARRYGSVEALARDIERYLDGRPVQARPPRIGYQLQKYLQRHRWAVGLGTLSALALLSALGLALWHASEARHEAARAQALQRFVLGLFDHAGGAQRSQGMAMRELLSAGARRGEIELGDQPLAQAELLGVIARLYIGIGDYREALVLSERQRQLLDGDGGAPPAGLRLDAAGQHGRVLRLLSRSQECVARMQPLAATAQRLQEQLPQQAADFYIQYGRCRRMLGEPIAARQWYERAIALRHEVLHDDAGVAEGLIDLAALESDAARTEVAIGRFLDAQRQLRARVGDRHPLMVDIQRSLGALYLDRGQAAEAESALRSGLALALELHGPNHPSTLAVRRQLGLAYLQEGRLAEAGQALQAQHGPTETLLGPQHHETGLSLDALGRLALEQGDADAAAAAFTRAVAIWRQPDGRHLLDYGLADLAQAQQGRGDPAAARAALEEARQLRSARLGASHPAVGDLDRSLGELQLDAGDATAAAPWLERAGMLTAIGYGPDDPRTLQAQLALVRLRAGGHGAGAALERFAAGLPDAAALAPLRWEARAWAAQADCRDGRPVAGARRLHALEQELRDARPEGGSLQRKVARMALACDGPLNGVARAAATR